MGYAFISYSSIEQTSADAMRELFSKHNINTWMAPYDIPAGSSYLGEINRAVSGCACLVLMLSEAAQNSQWVIKEVERAVNYKKTIIPVQIEDVVLNDDFGFVLGACHVVAVRKIDENSAEVKNVLNAVCACINTCNVDNISNPALVVAKEAVAIVETDNTDVEIRLTRAQRKELLSCKCGFCGMHAEVLCDTDGYYTRCVHCGAVGTVADSVDSAIKNWHLCMKENYSENNNSQNSLWDTSEETEDLEYNNKLKQKLEAFNSPLELHKDYESYMSHTITLQKSIWDSFEEQIKTAVKETAKWHYNQLKHALYKEISSTDNTSSRANKYETSYFIVGRSRIKLSDEWVTENYCHIEFIEENLPARYNGEIVMEMSDEKWKGEITVYLFPKKACKKGPVKEYYNGLSSNNKEEVLPIDSSAEYSCWGELLKREFFALAEKDKLEFTMQPCDVDWVPKNFIGYVIHKKKEIIRRLKHSQNEWFEVSLSADDYNVISNLNNDSAQTE